MFTYMIIDFLSFVAGVALALYAMRLSYKLAIRRIKKDFIVALDKQAKESYQAGWMHCLRDKKTSQDEKQNLDETVKLTVPN